MTELKSTCAVLHPDLGLQRVMPAFVVFPFHFLAEHDSKY